MHHAVAQSGEHAGRNARPDNGRRKRRPAVCTRRSCHRPHSRQGALRSSSQDSVEQICPRSDCSTVPWAGARGTLQSLCLGRTRANGNEPSTHVDERRRLPRRDRGSVICERCTRGVDKGPDTEATVTPLWPLEPRRPAQHRPGREAETPWEDDRMTSHRLRAASRQATESLSAVGAGRRDQFCRWTRLATDTRDQVAPSAASDSCNAATVVYPACWSTVMQPAGRRK